MSDSTEPTPKASFLSDVKSRDDAIKGFFSCPMFPTNNFWHQRVMSLILFFTKSADLRYL